ncbi:IS3 family transposase [Bradyrhizobium betae]
MTFLLCLIFIAIPAARFPVTTPIIPSVTTARLAFASASVIAKSKEEWTGENAGTKNEARADVFDYIERFYNAVRRHSTIGYVSPVEFERKVGLA